MLPSNFQLSQLLFILILFLPNTNLRTQSLVNLLSSWSITIALAARSRSQTGAARTSRAPSASPSSPTHRPRRPRSGIITKS